jgi:competence protein ComEC
MGPVHSRGLAFRALTTALPLRFVHPASRAPRTLAGWTEAFGRMAEAEAAARRPFLWIPVAMGAGAALYFAADAEPSVTAGLAATLLAGILALSARRRHRVAMAVFIGLAALFAGFTSALLRSLIVAAPVLDRPRSAAIEGLVLTVEPRSGDLRLTIRVTAMAGVPQGALPLQIRVTARSAPVKAGDSIMAMARLMPPPPPSLPGGYDFAREAYFRQIGAVGSLAGRIEPLSPSIVPSWPERVGIGLDRLRSQITARILAVVGGQSGAVAAALVTGQRGFVSEETNDALRRAGIYHVISISGLHMVLAAGLVFWLVRAALAAMPGMALLLPIKKAAALAGIGAALAYGLFAGAEVATVRSMLMTMLMLGAILADRRALTMRNLALAGILLVALEPEQVLGPSFQMSFFAVAALIALHEKGQHGPIAAEGLPLPVAGREAPDGPPPSRLTHWVRTLGMPVLATLACELATAPFSLFHFQQIAPYGLIGNAITLPVVSFVVMPAALIGAAALPFGLDAPVWWVMGQGVWLMLEAARLVARLPGSALITPALPGATLVLLCLALLWLCLWITPLRWLAVLPAAAALAAGTRAPPFDLVVAQDGRSLMARDGAGLLRLVGASPGGFVLTQWLHADGDARSPQDPGLANAAGCDPLGCVARLRDGRAVALVRDARAFEEDCGRAAIIVTPLRAPAWCRAALVLDRTALARIGAVEIRAGPGETPAVVGAHDGARPWRAKPSAAAQPTPPDAGRPTSSPSEPVAPEIAAGVPLSAADQ